MRKKKAVPTLPDYVTNGTRYDVTHPDLAAIGLGSERYNMTAEHFQATLEAMMSRKPFQRFTIELNTGQRYEIGHPRAAAFEEGAAVLLAPGGVPVFFDHDSVNQIINSPAHAAPGKEGNSSAN